MLISKENDYNFNVALTTIGMINLKLKNSQIERLFNQQRIEQEHQEILNNYNSKPKINQNQYNEDSTKNFNFIQNYPLKKLNKIEIDLMNHRVEIEKKYNRSYENRNYIFPRINCDRYLYRRIYNSEDFSSASICRNY